MGASQRRPSSYQVLDALSFFPAVQGREHHLSLVEATLRKH
jgi:hypothetical protein